MLLSSVYWQKVVYFLEFFGVGITVILLPIDRFPYLHHIPFSLGFISLVLLLAATGARLLEIYFRKDRRALKRYALVGLLLALPVIGYAQSIHYAIDRQYALGATKLLLAAVLRAFCIYILVSENRNLLNRIKKLLYAMTAIIVAFGFFQFFFDIFGASQNVTDLSSCCTSNSTYIFPRVHPFSIEPLYFSNFLLIPIWLLAYDFLKNKRLRSNKKYIGLFIATSLLFLLSLSRGAILGLLIGTLVLYLGLKPRNFDIRKWWKFLAKLWGGALIVTLILVIISGVAASTTTPKHAINGSTSGVAGNVQIFSAHAVNVVDDSAKTRYTLWPKSIDFIKHHLLKGVGAYNSRVILNQAQYENGRNPTALQPFNNDLIGLLVDLGLIGVIAFGPLIAVLFIIIKSLHKIKWDSPITPYSMALIGMLVQSNFFHAILLTRLWFVVGLVLTFYGTSKQAKQKA